MAFEFVSDLPRYVYGSGDLSHRALPPVAGDVRGSRQARDRHGSIAVPDLASRREAAWRRGTRREPLSLVPRASDLASSVLLSTLATAEKQS
jgi:hypothetical protein